ncbi:hypothetical protein [Hymenobacter koreensis]|uniref:Uncharacterized protein n=1 Tax=Hymenobacter koreensis TaxID=1084523 RepID=A0ABP8JLV2_9BACT
MKTHTLLIQDETATGSVLHRLALEISQETLTVRELIAQRVHQEVAAYNQRCEEHYFGLVQPTDSERTLNGYRMRQRKPIDFEKQLYQALQAFQQNGYFILVNDRQVETLDEQIWLGEGATASFVKLTPLVGG